MYGHNAASSFTTSTVWNSSNLDTNGREEKHEEGVHISEVSVFQGQNRLFLGKRIGILIIDVSSFQGCP